MLIRFWYDDPTIILKRDIRDQNNRIIATRGAAINPRIASPLNETLLFFDADDARQLKFIRNTLKRIKANSLNYKLIIVQGYYENAEKKLRQPVYVDQHSELVNRFHIQRLPTVITQVILRLKVEEFPMLKVST